MLLSSADLFLKSTFKKKNLPGIPSLYQTDWIQIRPDVLFWIRTVDKDSADDKSCYFSKFINYCNLL